MGFHPERSNTDLEVERGLPNATYGLNLLTLYDCTLKCSVHTV